jgi:hypothetical protein
MIPWLRCNLLGFFIFGVFYIRRGASLVAEFIWAVSGLGRTQIGFGFAMEGKVDWDST